MRKVSFALAAGFLLACGGGDQNALSNTAANPPAPTTPAVTATAPASTDAKPAEAKKPSPAEAMQKTMAEYGAAMQASDAKKLAALYADNAVMKMPGMPDVTGRDAIEKHWTQDFATFSNGKSTATRVFTKGDVAVVEWVFNATHTGDLGPIKATEKPVGVSGADVMWFTPEGKIKEAHSYMDMGTVMSQIGVSKQKARAIPTVPTTPPDVITATSSETETKNADAAKKMMGAFEKKSDADFMAGAADDIQWDDMTQPDTMKGKAAGKKYFKAMTTAFPDIKVNEQNVWGIGDFVIAEGTLTGTHKGAFYGIQPTKKQMNVHGLDIMQFKDGKIVHGCSYANSAEMAEQLGLIAHPADAKGKTPAKADGKAPAKPAPAKPAPAKPAPAKK
jgi:steroid delta-isomerase-like uncharacterized protein/uncharacterized protein (TIGR02246 family)